MKNPKITVIVGKTTAGTTFNNASGALYADFLGSELEP